MIYKLVHLQNIDAKRLIHPIYDQDESQIRLMMPSILCTSDEKILNIRLTSRQWLQKVIQRVHDIDTTSTRHRNRGRRSAESRTGHVKGGRGCDGGWVGPMIRFACLDERKVARKDRGRHRAGHVRGA